MSERIPRPTGSISRSPHLKEFRLLLCFVVALGTASCALWRGSPGAPDPTVEAYAWATVAGGRATSLSAAEEAPLMNRLSEHTFAGEITAAYPPSASGEAQRIALGRAAARREALRKFSSQVREFGSAGDPTFVRFFGSEEDWIEDFEAYLETGVRIEYENRDRGVTATIAIPGEDVFAWFNGRSGNAAGPNSGAARVPSSDLPERRLEAKAEAIALARETLIAHLGDIAKASRRFSFLRPRDRALEARLRSRIENQEPDQLFFTDDARCVAIMTFPRAELERLQRGGARVPGNSGVGRF